MATTCWAAATTVTGAGSARRWATRTSWRMSASRRTTTGSPTAPRSSRRSRTLTRAQLDATLKEAGVPGSPVNDLQQVLVDPFAAERGILQPLTGRDDVQAVKFPVSFAATPVTEY